MFFFVSPLVLRGPSTDRPETSPHDRNLAEFYEPTPRTLPQKILGQNMQNFGQFWTTSDFDREYLRNDWRYPKSAGVDEKRPVNFGPLTAWNYIWVWTQ